MKQSILSISSVNVRRNIFYLAGYALAIMILIGLQSGALSFLFSGLRLVLVIAALWFAPGVAVTKALSRHFRHSPILLVPVSFCISTGSVLILSIFAYLGEWPLSRLLAGPLVLLCVGIILEILRIVTPARKNTASTFTLTKIDRWIIVLAVLAAVLAWWLAFNLDGGEDVYHIIGKVVKLVGAGIASPLANAYTIPTQPDVGFGFNGWQLVLALTSSLAGVEPILVYFWTVPILAFLKVLAVYGAAVIFFRSRGIGAATAVVFLADIGLHSTSGVNLYTAYPNSIGWYIFLPVITALTFIVIRNPRRRLLPFVILAMLGASLAAVHKVHFLNFFIAFGAFAALALLVHKKPQAQRLTLRILLVLLVVFLAGAVQIGVEAAQSQRFSAPAFQNLIVPNIVPLGDGLYILDFNLASLSTGLVILLLPLFWVHMKRKDWAVYLVASSLVPFLLLLNPVLFPLLTKYLYIAAPRVAQVIPVHFALGFGLWLLWRHLQSLKNRLSFSYQSSVRWVALGTLLLVAVLGSRGALFGKHLFHLSPYQITQPGAAIELVQQEVPAGATVLSDFATSERLPAYADVYTVVWPLGQAGTGADYGDLRIADMERMFQPGTPLEEILSLLNYYGVDYILYDEAEAMLNGLTDEAYRSRPDLFPIVAELTIEKKVQLPSLRAELLLQQENERTQWRITIYQVKR